MNLKSSIKRVICRALNIKPKIVTANISYLQPNCRLQGKRIAITGGGRGLGAAMARKFVQEGATVLIAGRNEENLKKLSNEIDCKYLVLDVSKTETFNDFMVKADHKLGGINCLVNNAGISLHEKDYTNITEETFDKQISINMRGGFFLSKEFVMLQRSRNEAGTILFTSSETGETVDERPYGWTKAAINSLVQGLAYKLTQDGFRINAVAPGITASDMTGLSSEGNLYYTGNILERVYMPEEVAEVATFLLSDASGCLNGQILYCNNGKTINARWK